jgi:hypothetical protein
MSAPAAVQFCLDPTAAVSGDVVVRPAPVVFRAGKYPFPPEEGGDFEMTPQELASFAGSFQGSVPIDVEHTPTVLDGKLGRVHSLKATPEGVLQGQVELPGWLDRLLGASERKLSALWDRATKTLKRVSLVREPRIPDATFNQRLVAAFAAAAPAADPALDPAAAGTTDPAAVLQQIAQEVANPDADPATCLERIRQLVEDSGYAAVPPAAGGDMAGMSLPADATRREKSLYAKFARRFREQQKKEREAAFAAAVGKGEADVDAFLKSQEARERLLPFQLPTEEAVGKQAARDDAARPAEVSFSRNGQAAKGSRVEAWKAGVLARQPHGRLREALPQQQGTAAFAPTPGQAPPGPDVERVNKLLASTAIGRDVLREQKKEGK